MKTQHILIIISLSISTLFAQKATLFPVKKGDLWGYIDKTGKLIVEYQYQVVEDFSEGLAAVRQNGIYGYIDTKGKIIIPPQYDLVLPFKNGQAKVFLDGKPFFIDKQGNKVFEHPYKSMGDFGSNTFAVVLTNANKYGLINHEGKLIADTVFTKMSPFVSGLSIVEGLNHVPYKEKEDDKIFFEVGVIDTLGKWIVKYGRYKDINPFKNGYAKVELMKETNNSYEDDEGIIDNKGNYKFTIPAKKWYLNYGDEVFYDGIALVNIYSVNPELVKVWSSHDRNTHCGAINTNGEIICEDLSWNKLTPFIHNRAFAQNYEDKWFLVNLKGKKMNNELYEEICFDEDSPETTFEEGIAFVKTAKGWKGIDTMGKTVIAPQSFKMVDDRHVSRNRKKLFVLDGNYQYVLTWDTEKDKLIYPPFEEIVIENTPDDLIYKREGGRMQYINHAGEVVWQEDTTVKKQAYIDIDFMNRGYFYAASENKPELNGHGGWGRADNSSQKIPPSLKKKERQFQVIIDTTQKIKWAGNYEGFKLYILNESNNTRYFDAQDSRLYMKLQAKNKKGEWQDIEYLPSSWCGNSYHSLFLAPNEYWEFEIPNYHGGFKTNIRAELLYKAYHEQKESTPIYSNEIEGSINPGQFWNKREYSPNGLMDPYND